MNLQEYGNTSAASIPILLDEWNKKDCSKREISWCLPDLEQDFPGREVCWNGKRKEEIMLEKSKKLQQNH